MRCDICESETKIIRSEDYQYTLSGVATIFLKNIQLERCEKCDLEVPHIPKIIRLHETIVRALVLKPSLLSGEEVRFLRKNLRMKAQDWAICLRKDAATISRAEKDGQKLNKDLDLLMRLAFVRLWEEKKGEVFPEHLPVLQDVEQGILIDVNDIESFSYFNIEEVWQKATFINSAEFDYANDFGKTAIFGGEDAGFEASSPYSLREFYAENRELALAG